MFHSPRRPYYNRSDNMPHSAQTDDSATIDSKRFWKLLKNLRNRQEDAKKDEKRKAARTG